MFGELNTAETDQLLRRQLIGRIGCHDNDTTYVVPVSYAYDGTYVYVHTYEGKKMDMMRKNPSICFQVDDTRSFASWQSAVCWGQFEELSTEEQKREAQKILNARILPMLTSETMQLSELWPFPAGDDENLKGIYFRIRLTEKTGRFEKSDQPGFLVV